jgi:hypothetical protein
MLKAVQQDPANQKPGCPQGTLVSMVEQLADFSASARSRENTSRPDHHLPPPEPVGPAT